MMPITPKNVCMPVIYPRFYEVEYSLIRYKLAVSKPDIPIPNILNAI
jgi:hypothetical protein